MTDKPNIPPYAKKPGFPTIIGKIDTTRLPTITEHPDPLPPPIFHDEFLIETFPMYFIALDEIIFVAINKQLVNTGGIDIEGVLNVDGQFFVEE